MTTDEFIQHFGAGNVTHAARNSGFRRATIYGWVHLGYIPLESQYRAEIVSEGALRADRPKIERTEAS